MTTKLDYLALTRYYTPGFRGGGPIQSVSNLVKAFGGEIRFGVLTTDRDFGDTHAYQNLETELWTNQNKSKTYYTAPGRVQWLRVLRVLLETQYRVLYLNSFFDRSFSIIPILLLNLLGWNHVQILIAPRGEFTPGALKIKRVRKTLYICLARASRLYSSAIWHASSEDEKKQILKVMGAGATTEVAMPSPSAGIHVAQDLLAPKPPSREDVKNRGCIEDGVLKIIFLSRITRMKNLIYALQVLAEIDRNCVLDIYGTVDDPRYVEECRKYANTIPPRIQIRWHSEVKHEHVAGLLSCYDVLFLPTLGENFGHVIGEALSVGLPVLISDRTPWKGIQESGAGWVIPIEDRRQFVTVITSLADSAPEDRRGFSRNAERYYTRYASEHDALQRNREMLRRALNEVRRESYACKAL